jgi:hypothetical protein
LKYALSGGKAAALAGGGIGYLASAETCTDLAYGCRTERHAVEGALIGAGLGAVVGALIGLRERQLSAHARSPVRRGFTKRFRRART